MIHAFFQALIALFVVSTKDGWVEIMRQGTDGVDVDMQVSTIHFRNRSFAHLLNHVL